MDFKEETILPLKKNIPSLATVPVREILLGSLELKTLLAGNENLTVFEALMSMKEEHSSYAEGALTAIIFGFLPTMWTRRDSSRYILAY